MKNKNYTSLISEIRTHLPTEEVAYHLSLKPQTLRSWGCPSCPKTPPIIPVKIGNKLLWSVDEIKRLLKID